MRRRPCAYGRLRRNSWIRQRGAHRRPHVPRAGRTRGRGGGLAVADDCQRHGVGRALYAAALSSAESRGIHQLEATLFAYNNSVRLLLTGAGRPYRIESDELGTLYLTIDLAGTQAA
jgi:GNAT superfamily N-acetyltransferase